MRIQKTILPTLFFVAYVVLTSPFAVSVEVDVTSRLANDLAPWLDCLSGKEDAFSLNGQASLEIDGKNHELQFQLERIDDEAFDLQLTHADYAVHFRRRIDGVAAF